MDSIIKILRENILKRIYYTWN